MMLSLFSNTAVCTPPPIAPASAPWPTGVPIWPGVPAPGAMPPGGEAYSSSRPNMCPVSCAIVTCARPQVVGDGLRAPPREPRVVLAVAGRAGVAGDRDVRAARRRAALEVDDQL